MVHRLHIPVSEKWGHALHSKGSLILHSDQGSQYTSKVFIEFCESVHVTQSMSKARYLYDNAQMERFQHFEERMH